MTVTALIDTLQTTLLWENVYHYVESLDQAKILVSKTYLANDVAVETAAIQDSEDFFVTTAKEHAAWIIVDFEMPFILTINKKYNIQAVATGRLRIPAITDYPYSKHDFLSMSKKDLLSLGNIVSILGLDYRYVEVLGMW